MTFSPSYNSGSDSWIGHYDFAHRLVRGFKPKVLVECGVFKGDSFFCMMESAEHDMKGYAVDTWAGDPHVGFYHNDVYEMVKRESTKYNCELLRMTFDEAASKFEDNSIDLLHIDGYHTYDAVSHDYVTWLPKVKSDGIMMFHDIAVRKGDFGVWKFWEEIKDNYRTLSFDHCNGLGVVFLG